MKKWKPTKTWARKAKRAIQETIDDYKEHGLMWKTYGYCAKRGGCPLCAFGKVIRGDGDIYICDKCPWIVLGGTHCGRADFYNTKLSTRLRRLRRWLKKCDNIINK